VPSEELPPSGGPTPHGPRIHATSAQNHTMLWCLGFQIVEKQVGASLTVGVDYTCTQYTGIPGDGLADLHASPRCSQLPRRGRRDPAPLRSFTCVSRSMCPATPYEYQYCRGVGPTSKHNKTRVCAQRRPVACITSISRGRDGPCPMLLLHIKPELHSGHGGHGGRPTAGSLPCADAEARRPDLLEWVRVCVCQQPRSPSA
jgi:hypothetical protein